MKPLVQLVLDLFDPPAPPAPTVAPAPTTPAPPPVTTPSAVQFTHPRANRQIRLDGALVAYEFKRGRRRTIGFVVGPDGLVVSAPRWITLADVDAAVREKSGWILRKLAQAQERQQRLAAARIVWQDGAVLPFMGQDVRIELEPRHGMGPGGAALDAERGVLQLALARNATTEQIRDAVQAWLMRQARRVFTDRLTHYAPQLGVQWTKLTLSSAGTRWGSASVNGSIRLNWRLIHLRLPVIDYVVVHELSHLRVMDHSPRFWDTVASIVPDYAALRGQLKEEALPQWS